MEIWIIISCLGLGREARIYAVCLALFLSIIHTWQQYDFKPSLRRYRTNCNQMFIKQVHIYV